MGALAMIRADAVLFAGSLTFTQTPLVQELDLRFSEVFGVLHVVLDVVIVLELRAVRPERGARDDGAYSDRVQDPTHSFHH
jgi:hypothetical protein